MIRVGGGGLPNRWRLRRDLREEVRPRSPGRSWLWGSTRGSWESASGLGLELLFCRGPEELIAKAPLWRVLLQGGDIASILALQTKELA